MASGGSNLDPRFDPLFQRGYQGVSRDAVAPPPVHISEPPQVARPAVDPERVSTAAPPQRGVDDERYLPVVMTESAGERPEPRRLFNPFIVLLWIIGPGLSALGMVGTQELWSQQWSNNFSPEEAGAMQGLMMAAQSAVTVGFATVGGLLFWHAAAWRRARS